MGMFKIIDMLKQEVEEQTQHEKKLPYTMIHITREDLEFGIDDKELFKKMSDEKIYEILQKVDETEHDRVRGDLYMDMCYSACEIINDELEQE